MNLIEIMGFLRLAQVYKRTYITAIGHFLGKLYSDSGRGFRSMPTKCTNSMHSQTRKEMLDLSLNV